MIKSNFMFTSYYYHYSPMYKYSIGVEYMDDKHFKEDYLNLRATYLIDRKNTSKAMDTMSLLDLCHRFKAASNIKPPSRKDVEKRVERAIAQEMADKRLRAIRKELEKLAPNHYAQCERSPDFLYSPSFRNEARGYNEALDRLAAALAKELP